MICIRSRARSLARSFVLLAIRITRDARARECEAIPEVLRDGASFQLVLTFIRSHVSIIHALARRVNL